MSYKGTTIIAMSNETTASQDFYEVSDEVLSILLVTTEEELSRIMPKQVAGANGYESVAYANALVEMAREYGVPEHSIVVREVSVPQFFFDTGWTTDPMTRSSEAEEHVGTGRVSVPSESDDGDDISLSPTQTEVIWSCDSFGNE